MDWFGLVCQFGFIVSGKQENLIKQLNTKTTKIQSETLPAAPVPPPRTGAVAEDDSIKRMEQNKQTATETEQIIIIKFQCQWYYENKSARRQ